MKVGELKIECLMYMFPSQKISYASDDDSITSVIDNLRHDPNYSDLMVTMIGAINRSIDIISALCPVRKSRISLKDIVWESKDGAYRAPMNIEDFLSIEESDAPCEIIDGYIYAWDEIPEYIVCKKKHFLITQSTPDTRELLLSESLCHLIPLYVKGELYTLDEKEREYAKNDFKWCISVLEQAEKTSGKLNQTDYRVE
ncbi:MAG: hypothetical protein IJW54_07740 [Clostridia bacterium]|nr:hypothetical protein [Clostridia bacterium]